MTRHLLWALAALAGCALAFQPDPAILRGVYEEALSRRERDYGPSDPRTAQACRDLGFYLRGIGDMKSAAPLMTRVVRIDEASYGPKARQTMADVVALASVSPSPQADSLLKRAVASPDPDIAGPALATLGDLRKAAGDKAGAAVYWRQALAQAESIYGQDGAVVGTILNTLAPVVSPVEGVAMLRRALRDRAPGWGERHPETATTEVNLAGLLLKSGHRNEAAEIAAKGLADFEATLGPEHPRTAAAARTLADVLLAQGNAAGAERLYRRSLTIDNNALGAGDPQTLSDARTLTALLRRRATAGH